MSKFESWGYKYRNNPEYGYASTWHDLLTVRVRADQPLPAVASEFYDVSLGHKCNMQCPFCYTSAEFTGREYRRVVDKIQLLMHTIWRDPNHRPFQVAIGSEGEPTIHPEFIQVLQTFYDNGIVPNYTTNGRIFTYHSYQWIPIVEATEKYCGGVALSAHEQNPYWQKAFEILKFNTQVPINLHLIVSDLQSLRYLERIIDVYDSRVHTFVILPLIKAGRSTSGMTDAVYKKLVSILNTYQSDRNQFAVGARMNPWLLREDLPQPEHIQQFEPEMFSKNLILDDTIRITPSSFDTGTTLWSIEYRGNL